VKDIVIGATRRDSFEPRPADLASAIGNKGVDVVSSPATIGYLEMASHLLIASCFEGDEASVGVGFQFRHLAAAHLGELVIAEAELIAIDRRRYTFHVEARQAGRLIMDGEHQRAVVNLGRFLPEPPEATGAPLTFWFDVHSPFAYLAALRIGDLGRRLGRPVIWEPLQLPRLQVAIDGRTPLEENPAFVAWFQQDLQDQAALQDVEVRYHPDWPLRNSRALRACLKARDLDQVEAFAIRVMRGYWSEDADITDPQALAGFARYVGLDGDAIAAATGDPDLKARLEANTVRAIERGVFGVPTVDTGEKLYFGNDRLDLLERHLMQEGR